MISKRESRRNVRGLATASAESLSAAADDLAVHFGLDVEFFRKFTRYFLVGGTCALIDWVVFAAVFYNSEFHYLVAATVSFLFATGVNYFLSVRYVFDRGERSRRSAITLVYIASAVGIAVNLGVLSAFIEFFGFHAMVAKIAGTCAAFGWNFGSRYYWIFNR